MKNRGDMTTYAMYIYILHECTYNILLLYTYIILHYILYLKHTYDTLSSPDQPLDQILSQLLGELGHGEIETKLAMGQNLWCYIWVDEHP